MFRILWGNSDELYANISVIELFRSFEYMFESLNLLVRYRILLNW